MVCSGNTAIILLVVEIWECELMLVSHSNAYFNGQTDQTVRLSTNKYV